MNGLLILPFNPRLTNMASTPVTQIIYLNVSRDKTLSEDQSDYYGRLWVSALDVIERSEGFQRVYWGRSLERPEDVQVHVGTFHTSSVTQEYLSHVQGTVMLRYDVSGVVVLVKSRSYQLNVKSCLYSQSDHERESTRKIDRQSF